MGGARTLPARATERWQPARRELPAPCRAGLAVGSDSAGTPALPARLQGCEAEKQPRTLAGPADQREIGPGTLLPDRVRDDEVEWAPVGHDQTPGSTRVQVAGLGAALLWLVGG